MFDIVRNNKKIAQIILGVIALTFAFFGIEGYMRDGPGAGAIATIGDIKITQQQFSREMQDRQERLRAQMGAAFDAKMMDTPEMRRAVLDQIINRQVLLLEAQKLKLVVTNESLYKTIASINSFQENGQFSKDRYERRLREEGMNPAMFEAQMRQDMLLKQLTGSIEESAFSASSIGERLAGLQTEKREVREYRFLPEKFLPDVKLQEGAAKKFYESNGKQFEIPEQAKAEFVILSMDGVAAQLTISEKEIKDWYDANRSRYTVKDLAKTKAKAEVILKQVKADPQAFAELAKKHSKDPGTGENGGDLGFFAKGAMVKPFADAAFKMKEGEISGLVESEFGVHIIKLTGIRKTQGEEERRASHILIGFETKEQPLPEVRAAIESELKKTMAGRKFAEAAEGFANAVYEQSDSLKPAAEKYKLAVQQSGWLVRTPNPAAGPLGNEKLLKALFSEDSVKSRRNTEAVEIAPNTLVSARIVEYKPAAMQPFDNVKASIETLLKRQEAQAMAKKTGEEKLAVLKSKDDQKTDWSAVKSISRMDARMVPPQAVPVIFRLDAAQLPAFGGVEIPGAGYALYKLIKVAPGEKLDDERRKAILGFVGQLASQEDMQAYLTALKTRYKVKIDQAALEASKDNR